MSKILHIPIAVIAGMPLGLNVETARSNVAPSRYRWVGITLDDMFDRWPMDYISRNYKGVQFEEAGQRATDMLRKAKHIHSTACSQIDSSYQGVCTGITNDGIKYLLAHLYLPYWIEVIGLIKLFDRGKGFDRASQDTFDFLQRYLVYARQYPEKVGKIHEQPKLTERDIKMAKAIEVDGYLQEMLAPVTPEDIYYWEEYFSYSIDRDIRRARRRKHAKTMEE